MYHPAKMLIPHTHTILAIRETVGVRERRSIEELSTLSGQFFYKPKTALKMKSIKKKPRGLPWWCSG